MRKKRVKRRLLWLGKRGDRRNHRYLCGI
jgi:hypothetical protein